MVRFTNKAYGHAEIDWSMVKKGDVVVIYGKPRLVIKDEFGVHLTTVVR